MTKITFTGKSEIYSHHMSIPHHELVVDKKKSVGGGACESIDDNLIIQGDNLLALKSLLSKYEGKVKCIYIDPPYNTNKDVWVYNDNVSSPSLKHWLGKVVDINDTDRHEKWLCMMYPRLCLLKELLADDGVIFISIDDNEQHRLRMLMDEVFGEGNFIGCITREQKKGANRGTHLASAIDYVLTYSKTKENVDKFHLPITQEYIDSFKEDDEDGRGKYKLKNLYEPTLDYYENCRYPVKCPDGEIITTPELKSFSHSKESFNEMLENNAIVFSKGRSSLLITEKGKKTLWSVKRKLYLDDKIRKGRRPANLLLDIINTRGKKEIHSLNLDFNYPKPTDLLKFLLSIINDKSAIVLDSFAGSGTTAHATLALNKEDGGNRKFILVQCDEWDKDKKKEINLCDKITAERVRKVIKGVPDTKDKLGGTFTYCKVGEAIDFNKIITGERLPTYKQLSELLFLQITGSPLGKTSLDEKTWFVGETDKYKVHLIYKNNIEFLQGRDAYLTLDLLEKMAKKLKTRQKLIVFAPGRYLDYDHLIKHNAMFFYIPHEVHRHLDKK